MANLKPILFSTPMVRAILDGRKTMTRRVIKAQGKKRCRLALFNAIRYISGTWFGVDLDGGPFINDFIEQCHYQVGDILWVRETWQIGCEEGGEDYGYFFKADFENVIVTDLYGEEIKWRPSIFMPKEAARIFLRVTDVRAERLQDIRVQDAKDEGIKAHANGCKDGLAFGCYNGDDCVYNRCERPIEYFHELWDSINAKRGYEWDTNPWVWVISFERCEKPEDIS